MSAADLEHGLAEADEQLLGHAAQAAGEPAPRGILEAIHVRSPGRPGPSWAVLAPGRPGRGLARGSRAAPRGPDEAIALLRGPEGGPP